MIDRCGKHFGTILNYLRDGAVPLPESRREIEELLAEAKYYLVQGLVDECQAALQVNLLWVLWSRPYPTLLLPMDPSDGEWMRFPPGRGGGRQKEELQPSGAEPPFCIAIGASKALSPNLSNFK